MASLARTASQAGGSLSIPRAIGAQLRRPIGVGTERIGEEDHLMTSSPQLGGNGKTERLGATASHKSQRPDDYPRSSEEAISW